MVNHYLQVGVDVDASSLAIKKKNILSSSLNGTLPFIQNNGDFNITTSLNSIQKIAKIYVPIVTKQLSNLQVPAMSRQGEREVTLVSRWQQCEFVQPPDAA